MLNMWGSRGAAVLDDEGSTPDVTWPCNCGPNDRWRWLYTCVNPVVGWYHHLKNISDADAEATFAALVGGLTSKMEGETINPRRSG